MASEGGSVSPPIALAFAAAAYVALAIFALGMTSLATNQDVIAVRGLGPLSGVFGMGLSTLAFAGGLWPALRRTRASYWSALGATVGAFLGYLVGAWFGALLGDADLAAATAGIA